MEIKKQIKVKTKIMYNTPFESTEITHDQAVGTILEVGQINCVTYEPIYKYIYPHRSYLAERRKYYWSKRNLPIRRNKKRLLALRSRKMRYQQNLKEIQSYFENQ